MKEQKKTEEKKNVKWPLIIYDLAIFVIASVEDKKVLQETDEKRRDRFYCFGCT